jgi:hypothetical protein
MFALLVKYNIISKFNPRLGPGVGSDRRLQAGTSTYAKFRRCSDVAITHSASGVYAQSKIGRPLSTGARAHGFA